MTSGGDVLIIVNACVSFFLALIVLRAKTDWPMKMYLMLLILFLPMYKNLEFFSHPAEMLSPEGIHDMWVRHIAFYIAQLFLFLFIVRIFDRTLEKEISTTHTKMPIAIMSGGLGVFFVIIMLFTYELLKLSNLPFTLHNINYFLTEHGIQHIVVLVFFFFSLATIRTYSLYPSYAPIRNFLVPLVLASGCFVSLHVFEYFNETLHLFPLVTNALGEDIEFIFQYVGLGVLGVAVFLLFKLTDMRELHTGHDV